VGAGQAVNILGKGFGIKGDYLTERDKEYIRVAKNLGIHGYMLSFVERAQDIQEVRTLDKDSKLVLKIESLPGLDFVARDYSGYQDCRLMAARDDLFINIGENKFDMIKALEFILEKDPNAICASHLFQSLDSVNHVNMADISDLELMKRIGYKNFMLSDEISHRHFDEAINAWQYFVKNG
jgi:pyruvate kinase